MGSRLGEKMFRRFLIFLYFTLPFALALIAMKTKIHTLAYIGLGMFLVPALVLAVVGIVVWIVKGNESDNGGGF